MATGARTPHRPASGPQTPPRTAGADAGQAPSATIGPSRYPPHFLRSVEVDGSGVATIELDVVPPGEIWAVELVRVAGDGVASSAAAVYDSQVSLDGLLDRTNQGNFDVLEGSPAWRLPSGSRLIVQWTGATAASRAHLRVQYLILGAS